MPSVYSVAYDSIIYATHKLEKLNLMFFYDEQKRRIINFSFFFFW